MVEDFTGGNNNHGILANGGAQADYMYDIAQFFADPITAFETDTPSSPSVQVSGLGFTIANHDTFDFGTPTGTFTCSLPTPLSLEFLILPANFAVTSLGYRGFKRAPTIEVPVEPNVGTAEP
jgi:hypothetical protein